MVPVALPKAYVMVCVKDEDFLFVLMVIEFDPVGITEAGETLGTDALGIVVKVSVPEQDIDPGR